MVVVGDAQATEGRVPTVMHVRCPDRLREEVYRQVLELLAGLSPVVQALPPTAALVELKGTLRYHGSETHRLGEVLRVRTLSRRRRPGRCRPLDHGGGDGLRAGSPARRSPDRRP